MHVRQIQIQQLFYMYMLYRLKKLTEVPKKDNSWKIKRATDAAVAWFANCEQCSQSKQIIKQQQAEIEDLNAKLHRYSIIVILESPIMLYHINPVGFIYRNGKDVYCIQYTAGITGRFQAVITQHQKTTATR